MPVDRTPPTDSGFAPNFVAASTLIKNADPPSYLAFLSTETPSKQTVRTSQGPIPVSSLHRVLNDRSAFHAYMAGPNCNDDSPPPRCFLSGDPSIHFATSKYSRGYDEAPLAYARGGARAQGVERLCVPRQDGKSGALAHYTMTQRLHLETRPRTLNFAPCRYGHFVPDAEIITHVVRKRQEMSRIDMLWDAAMHLRACPFDNPAPIAAYVEAARKFHTEFGHPYRRDDGRAAELTPKCRLHEVYTEFLATCRGDEEADRLIGQKFTYVYFVNPFASVDPRRRVLDTKYQLWADEIAALLKTAELDLLKDDGVRSPISTAEFSQLLRDLKN
ncbi:hypothetical protein K438DRAFT_1787004 [Mycena galopus ATCC 62051]|nr:hypothetical protein K438DRAFT_1787004 [Mycena galopus ATCC 62051]